MGFCFRMGWLFGVFWLPMQVSAQTTADCEGAVNLCGDFYSEENASFSTGEVME